MLGRTAPGAKATVGGVEVPALAAGIFVRDGVLLQVGSNQVPVVVTLRDGKLERTVEVRLVPNGEPAIAAQHALAHDSRLPEWAKTDPQTYLAGLCRMGIPPVRHQETIEGGPRRRANRDPELFSGN